MYMPDYVWWEADHDIGFATMWMQKANSVVFGGTYYTTLPQPIFFRNGDVIRYSTDYSRVHQMILEASQWEYMIKDILPGNGIDIVSSSKTVTISSNVADVESGNSNIQIMNSTDTVYVIGLATDFIRIPSGAITIDTSYDTSGRIEYVTFSVPSVISSASAVSGVAYKTFQKGNSTSLVSASDAESLMHVNPTPPVNVSFNDTGSQHVMSIWLDPTATPTMSIYESFEEALPVGTRTFRTAYEIAHIDRVTYRDIPTTNMARNFYLQEIPRNEYRKVPGATDEFEILWSPPGVNSISGGAVVYKFYIYYLYRAFGQ